MKHWLKLSAVFVTLLALIFGTQAQKASAMTYTLSEIAFTAGATATGDYFDPTVPNIDNDIIVWTDMRNGDQDIFMYNTLTATETPISYGAGNQSSPDISGDNVVYVNDFSGIEEIWGINIVTNTPYKITTGTTGRAIQPQISGDNIVWMDDRNGSWDIFMYNLSTFAETQITSAGNFQSPSIDGNIVAYESHSPGQSDIMAYVINTAAYITVTNDADSQYWPNVSGTRMVWMDDRNGTWDTYYFDFGTLTATRITTGAGLSVLPYIDGDRIVWTDMRNTNADIYMYDLSLGQEFQLTSGPTHQGGARIEGDKVVWGDNDGIAETHTGYYGLLDYVDSEKPVFNGLPGTKEQSNITQGMSVTTTPVNIQVRPTDDSGSVVTRFYAGDTLLCTVQDSDQDGVYACSFTPSCSTKQIRVEAEDKVGNITALYRDITVNTPVCTARTLPVTGASR